MALDVRPWVLAKKEFRANTQIQAKVYLESHRGRSELWRWEPAGLHGLRKQVTEAKEGPLGLRRKKAKVHALREERKKKGMGERERERESVECENAGAGWWRGREKGEEREKMKALGKEEGGKSWACSRDRLTLGLSSEGFLFGVFRGESQ